MRVISFDVGIKNMAYCVLDVSHNTFSVIDWHILNLMPATEKQKPLCNCIKQTKKKGAENLNICNKGAKYKKGEQLFCEKHAQASSLIVDPRSPAQLKKLKSEELEALCRHYGLNLPVGHKKKDGLECIQTLYAQKALDAIKPTQEQKAGEMDLITLGRNMTTLLDKLDYIDTITHVLIENQISPIANRMKTIQGMLTQYFIMKPKEPIRIEFISSANKLKGFVVEKSSSEKEPSAYKQHKQDSIVICRQFIEKNANLQPWKHCLEHVKKDDYADGFLQGIWYLKNKKIIDYNSQYGITVLEPPTV